jgi:hypothetical protein
LETARPRLGDERLSSSAALRGLLWLLSLDAQDKERVLKLVRHFHPPIAPRRQLSVHALKHLPRRDRCLVPSGVLVRKLRTGLVDLGPFVPNVEEV